MGDIGNTKRLSFFFFFVMAVPKGLHHISFVVVLLGRQLTFFWTTYTLRASMYVGIILI